jgi:hypothetical protein
VDNVTPRAMVDSKNSLYHPLEAPDWQPARGC